MHYENYIHDPVRDVNALCHKQGSLKLSNKDNSGFVIKVHVIYYKHPIPGVLHPSKKLLESPSMIAVVLFVHSIGLKADFDHRQAF